MEINVKGKITTLQKEDFQYLIDQDASAGELKKSYKLNQSHLEVSRGQRQRTYTAAQLLSRTNANHFKSLGLIDKVNSLKRK